MSQLHLFHRRSWVFALLVVCLCTCWGASAQRPATDLLPSWNEGEAKQAIIKFVGDVTQPGAATFVSASVRIAVFDNDGTLWAEQPVYFQFAFAIDRVRALAPQHPEWKDVQPFSMTES